MKKELLLKQVDELRKIKLPEKWEVAKLDVVFKRNGADIYQSAEVIYDTLNGYFYVKTTKSIVYESEAKPMLEAVSVMRKANKVIQK